MIHSVLNPSKSVQNQAPQKAAAVLSKTKPARLAKSRAEHYFSNLSATSPLHKFFVLYGALGLLQKNMDQQLATIPVYCLRKPLYLLLQHAKEKGGSYGDYALTDEHRSSIVADEAETFSPKQQEQDFCSENKIYFDNYYRITSHKTEILARINNHWYDNNKQGFEEENLRKTFISYVNKSQLQFPLYKSLTEWDADSVRGQISKPAELPTRFALAVCQLALLANNEFDESEVKAINAAQVNVIIEFIDRNKSRVEAINENDKLRKDEQNAIVDSHIEFWQATSAAKKLPPSFEKSKWICYERTDGISNSHAKWGVALSIIDIGHSDTNGYTPITLKSKYVSGESCHKGVITFDIDSVHLVAHLTRENKPLQTPALFIMRLNYMTPDAHDLLVGHFSYYSVYYGNFLTKTVIWIRTEGKEVLPIDLPANDANFPNIVPSYVRAFLSNRLRNRLTMPSTYLTNNDAQDQRHSIQQWLFDKNKNIAEDYILTECVGNYFVCYYYGDDLNNEQEDATIAKFIRVDELEIKYNEDFVEFETKYIHKRDASAKQKEKQNGVAEAIYNGVARRRDSTVQLILNELNSGSNSNLLADESADSNYIHLAFNTPIVHKVAMTEFNRYDYFPGIVSGLNDSNNEPVSFRMVVVRKDALVSKELQVEGYVFNPSDNMGNNILRRIIRYFKHNFNNNSIKIDAQSGKIIDQYPNLQELRLVGGNYAIRGGAEFEVECLFKDKYSWSTKGKDIDDLLKEADIEVSAWNFYE